MVSLKMFWFVFQAVLVPVAPLLGSPGSPCSLSHDDLHHTRFHTLIERLADRWSDCSPAEPAEPRTTDGGVMCDLPSLSGEAFCCACKAGVTNFFGPEPYKGLLVC